MDAVTVRMPGIVASAAALRQAADAGKGDARLVLLAFAEIGRRRGGPRAEARVLQGRSTCSKSP